MIYKVLLFLLLIGPGLTNPLSNIPDFSAIEKDSVLADPATTGTGFKVGGSYKTESDTVESSEIKRSGHEFSASFQHESGIKIIVFDRSSEFRLSHILDFDSKIQGSFTANAQGSAKLVDSSLQAIQDQIDAHAPGAGSITGGRASFTADAEGTLDGTVKGSANLDLSIKELERGIHVAIPLVGKPGGSQLVFETGFRQRTDFVVLKIASASLVAKAKARASVTGNAQADIDYEINGGALPNAFPFPYSPSISGTAHVERDFQENWSDQRSASVDLKSEMEKAGIPTELRSQRTYYVIPVGLGFYSKNGSKIRLLVDLKPERMMKPLKLNAPADLQKANEALSMISSARLEAEGRANFDSFTWLAGLNANFRTVEVSLEDVTGDDQAAVLPLHAGIQLYTGIQTKSWGVKLIGEAKYNINHAHAGGMVEINKSWQNGMTLGVITGYQKHIRAYGVPELRRSDTFTGNFDRSVANPHGSAQVNGNYEASHDSVVNEGQKGWQTYNAIPIEAMLTAPVGNGTGIVHGKAVFTDQDEKFKIQQAGGGVGYETAGDKVRYYFGASAYKTYPSNGNQEGGMAGGIDLGLSF
jgi:hypothetical protein